ncbi:efflux RND transporter periplasmic adaptor subunit [Fulvivirga lutimaris]|nr:efflux RND transporter periplasmic adaptor subunit [Fulvivirga lutimaris]
MKSTSTIFLLVIVLMSACGNQDEGSVSTIISNGNLEELRAKKKELASQLSGLEEEIALLDAAIGEKVGDKKLSLVTTHKASVTNFDHYVELQGNVTTEQNVLIYPEAAGTLLKVYVKKGQRVSKGQMLASIDDGGMSSQLVQMETQLALAETTFKRQERLWEQKIGTEIQYLQAKANYESLENNVKQFKGQLSKFSIRAPFSGIIDDVIKDQGTVVAPAGPGSEVFRIVNLSDMYIEVDVPESYIANVVPGKAVKVFFPILNRTIESKVRQTGNYINPNNRSFTVEVPVPNADGKIKPNMTAKVHINDYNNPEAILIPQSIVSENAEGEQYAYIASGVKDNVGTAKKNIITTGKTQGDFVEVLSGLKAGDNIIEEGARSVKDNQQVKILNK